jgi:hypothetical protein
MKTSLFSNLSPENSGQDAPSSSTQPTPRQYLAMALTSFAALGTILGAIYYALGIWNHLDSHAEHTDPPIKWVAISSLSPQDAPWIKLNWIGKEDPLKTFLINHSAETPIITLDGLGLGKIEWTPTEISEDGQTYRGPAICHEHGGLVDSTATLKRKVDNTLEYRMLNKCELYKSTNEIGSFANSPNPTMLQ